MHPVRRFRGTRKAASSPHDDPTVYRDRLPRDIARRLTAKPKNHIRNLLRSPTTPHRHALVATAWVWENRINLRLPLPEGRTTADTPKFSFGGPAFDEKLRQMEIWNTLGCYSVPTFGKDGKPEPESHAQEQWAEAYGRLVIKKTLRGPAGQPGTSSFHWGDGFGHLNRAPAELADYDIQLIGSSKCSESDAAHR